MSSSPDDFCQNANHIVKEKALMLNTIEVLDEEKENILSEVLRCYVCLELPKGKQVRICEEGHHCCHTCHKKIKACGICRGGLLEGRNFVVEQLVTKLGPILGVPKSELPFPEPPKKLTPGSYPCLHQCQAKVPAFQMLPHLRIKHSSQFLENVRSNPYSGHFSIKVNVDFVKDKKFIWSINVSDMGLFTVELAFFDLDFFGCVRMLANETVSSLFRYQLVVKITNKDLESFMEFSVTNCVVFSYLDDYEAIRNRANILKIRGVHLLDYTDIGSGLTVFVSIWEKKNSAEIKERPGTSLTCVPERHLNFESDRKKRRNKNRNMRRNRLKALKNSMRSDEISKTTEGLSNLAL